MTPSISYTTECRTINVKSCAATSYREMCQNFNSYELIPNDRKVKPYFDIEIKPKHCKCGQEYLDVAIEIANIALTAIVKHFNGIVPRLALLNASSANYKCCQSGETKWIISLHIVVSNYKISKQKCLSIVKEMNQTLILKQEVGDYFDLIDSKFKLFDESIYDANRKIRSCGANKTHWDKDTNKLVIEDRPFVIENDVSFESTVISEFFDDDTMEIPDDLPSKHTVSNSGVSIDLTEIQRLLLALGSKCESHQDWIMVAQILKNETKDEGLNDFLNWTNKFGSENKKLEAITHYTKHTKYTAKSDKKRLTIATLYYWVKQLGLNAHANADGHASLPSANADLLNDYIFEVADFQFAVLFNKLYKNEFVCVDKMKKEYYYFATARALWLQDSGGTPIRNKISTSFAAHYQEYQTELLIHVDELNPTSAEAEITTKKIKKIAEICIKLNKTGDKNNILSEISDLCKDVEFPSTLNKSEYMLPTNDGKVLNMKDLSTRNRTIDDKFSFQCGATFLRTADLSIENMAKVDTYFNDLFCGNAKTKQCVINILKSVFIGRPLRYIYFCIGNGNNGKSLLFKILNKIFGKFMDIISESVIIEQKGNKSALNTEIEKLDKCRLGYVTELKETDKLNEKVIKQISGGDAINLRTLHTKDYTINPTCNTFVLTNEMPSFNGEAKSMLNRMIVIPFKGNFAINDNFEKEMLELSDYIFSYIMYNGIISDKFDLSDEIIEEASKHTKNNTETTLEDYLKEHLIDCVNNKKDNKLIILNDLRVAFEAYCVTNKLKNSYTIRKFYDKMIKLGFEIKQSNSKTMLYGKKFKEDDLDDDDE